MNGINAAQSAHIKASENQQHARTLDRIRKKNKEEFDRTQELHSTTMNRLQKEFTSEEENLEIKLKQKLSDLHNKQKLIIQSESKRMEEELENLKLIHQDKVLEIKKNQDSELRSIVKNHQETLSTERSNYLKQKIKWQTS